MPRPFHKLLRIGLITLILFIIPFQAHALEDAVIAIVNDELITLKDLQEFMRAVYWQMKSDGRSDSEIDKELGDIQEKGINRLIENKLIVSEANRQGMQVRDAIIDRRIEEIRKRYANEEAFLKDLIDGGSTISDLRKKIADQQKAKFIVDREVKGKIYVNPQEVTDYYNQHKAELDTPESVNLDSIYIPYNEDAVEAHFKANEALKELSDGKDFKEIAKVYSQRPSLGIMTRGQMLPNLEDIVYKLAVGEVSGLVETDKGIYIFKLLEKFPGKITTLDESKDKIYNYIFQKKFQERYEEWIKKLKKNAYIEIKK